MNKIFFYLFILLFSFYHSSNASDELNFIGKWKFEKIVKVAYSLTNEEKMLDIYGKSDIEISDKDVVFCGEKIADVNYKIVKTPTSDRDPRFNNNYDSYQYGYGKDRKYIVFFRVFSKKELEVELEYFENSLIYCDDGYLIYFKK